VTGSEEADRERQAGDPDHDSDPPQQLQPQIPLLQESGTHAPLLHVSLHPQDGVHVFDGHIPFVHMPPPVQPHLPPQPSLPPQVPSLGHLGVQQLPP
jgi:hypothetical protein